MFRGFLKLSQFSPTVALYFLLGELPVEASLHISALTLFHNIWTNQHTTLHSAVKYILKMSSESSLTWSNHIQILCRKYSLPSPLHLLETCQPWTAEQWKCLVKTRVTVWFERDLRRQALPNSKLQYLNVQLNGLSGRPHPSLMNISTTQDAKKLRLHLKFLTGDYLTGWRRSQDLPGTDPSCKLCRAQEETTEHILTICPALAEERQRILSKLLNTVVSVQPKCKILSMHNPAVLTQFILDCTSINLEEDFRIPAHNPNIKDIFSVARDWCVAANNARNRKLKPIAK